MSLSFSADTVILSWKKTPSKHRDLVMGQPPAYAGGCFLSASILEKHPGTDPCLHTEKSLV